MNIKSTLLSTLLLIFFNSQSFGQLVSDSTFSQDGYFITSTPAGGSKYATRIKELSDGSILTVGCGGASNKFKLWKYSAAGTPVLSFGLNGEATNPQLDAQPGYVYIIKDIDTLENGKIIVLAEHTISSPITFDSTKSAILLVRFNADGSVDNTFNMNGYVIDKPVTGFEYHPQAMGIDKSEGKNEIYVGSWVVETGHATCPLGFGKWCLSKYSDNGSKSITFNNNTGFIQESSSILKQGTTQSPLATIHDLRVMPDGRVIVGGAMHNFDHGYFSFKILSDGQWDNTYGTNGRSIHTVPFEVPTNDLTNAQVLSDGSCVFYSILRYWGMGQGGTDSTELHGVKSSNTGSPLANFGNAGIMTFSYLSSQYPILIFKSDHSFLLSYYRPYGAQFADQKIEFMNFNANGIKNNLFGINGLLKTNPRSPDTYVNASQVLHGIWTNNETGIYLTCINQLPGANSENGVFKYKWPGLFPLQTLDHSINTEVLIYPNPVRENQAFYVTHQDAIQQIKVYSMTGALVDINLQKVNDSKMEITLPNHLVAGVYILSLKSESGIYTSRILKE